MIDPDLTGLFDKMLEDMQGVGKREAMQKAFESTPKELGAAAVWMAGGPQAKKIHVWVCGVCTKRVGTALDFHINERLTCVECNAEMAPYVPEEVVAQAKRYCGGCSYGSHCLGADENCACCKRGDVGCYPKE